MSKAKIAITLEASLLMRLDRSVRNGHFANRSQAVESAVGEKLDRLDRRRLAEECARLDPREERALAEEGLEGALDTWPAY